MVATKGETGREQAAKTNYALHGQKNVVSAPKKRRCLLVGVGTALRLERNSWSMVANGQMTKASNN